MQETLSPALPAGYSLQEYTLDQVLGIGGFGITYAATDTHLQHKVAIKEFFPSTLAIRNQTSGTVGIKSDAYKDEFLWGKNRYIQEAQTIAKFNHPNIVHVLRYFESNGTSYMVMALEDGISLEELLKKNSKLDWSENDILNLIIPILSGLTEVHNKHYLHRDIKPENIIIRNRDNSPVLIDFGSARSLMNTHLMTAMVTPGYGPVEQYSTDEGEYGPWSDIYALAAIMYRIITGRPPPPSINRIKRDSMLPAVFAGNGHYSKTFLSAIDHALAVEEKHRPQSVEDWITLLKAEPEPNQSETIQPRPQSAPAIDNCHPYDATIQPALPPIIADTPFQPIELPVTEPIGEDQDTPRSIHDVNVKKEQITRLLNFFTATTLLKTLILTIAIGLFGAIGWLFNDKAQLTILSNVYAFGKETRSPSMTYPLICKSYFESHIVDKGLSNDLNVNNITSNAQYIDDITLETSTNATLSMRNSAVELTKQTWFKPGFFWCRDILSDYKRSLTTPRQSKQKSQGLNK